MKGYIRRWLMRLGNFHHSNAFSYQLSRACATMCVLASVFTMWRSVCSLSHSHCPQAAINYRRVSSARTPPPLSLSATPAVSLSRQATPMTMVTTATTKTTTKASAISESWRNFSPCLLSAASIRHLCRGGFHWMHKIAAAKKTKMKKKKQKTKNPRLW